MATINFVREKRQVQVPEGTNLRKAALDAGIQLYPGVYKYLNCHGFGQCASCRVLVTKGRENISPRGWREKLRMRVSMAYIGQEESMRLACQTRVQGDIDVETQPALNLFGESFSS